MDGLFYNLHRDIFFRAKILFDQKYVCDIMESDG